MKPYRILIVDDEESILFALRRFFAARGFEIETSATLAEARSRLAAARFDMVIADLRISPAQGPEQTLEGLEILSLARSHSGATRTILLTAFNTRQVDDDARRRGVDLILHKPLPLGQLAAVVVELLAAREPRP
jgi:DNA-binding response OmpR family regulator